MGDSLNELMAAVHEWLDEIYYGVKATGLFTMVPLAPDPPFFARLHDAPYPVGRQFEVRVPVLSQVPDGPAALIAIDGLQSDLYDGHLRLYRWDRRASSRVQVSR